LAPRRVVMCIGRNDVAAGVAPATRQANYAAMVATWEARGAEVWHLLSIPEAAYPGETAMDTWILATYPAGRIMDPKPGWNAGTMLSTDNVHPTAVGHAHVAAIVAAALA
jgi:lysophospholipase L1-like esterase